MTVVDIEEPGSATELERRVRLGEQVSVQLVRDATAIVLEVGPEMVDVLGWQPAELVGKPFTSLIHPHDQNAAVAAWFEMRDVPGETRRWQGRYLTAQGSWAWIESENRYDEATGTVRTIMRLVEGTEASVEERLHEREELLSRLADALPVGLVQFDAELRVTFTNDRLHAMLGGRAVATVHALFAGVSEQDRPVLESAFAAVLADDEVPDFEIGLDGAGAPLVCSLAVRTLKDSAGKVTGGIACVSDVTERVQLMRGLEQRATTDPLTGCLNRSATWEVLEHLLRPEHIGKGVAVIFVDLDGFKEINDTLGHAAGDLVLEETARRLMSSIREGDQVGRIGGDEFLLICRNVSSRARARTLARRFSRSLDGQLDAWDQVIMLRGSAGVAWTSEPVSPEHLVARADEAMYARKAARAGLSVVQLPPDDNDGPIPRQGGGAA
ncbi:MAG: diguanylate cyclase domain-containing protein [Marmoricola sp.]